MDDAEHDHPEIRTTCWEVVVCWGSFVVPAACVVLLYLKYGVPPFIVAEGVCSTSKGMDLCEDWYRLAAIPGPFGLPVGATIQGMLFLALLLPFVVACCAAVYDNHKCAASAPSAILPPGLRASVFIRMLYKISPVAVTEYISYMTDEHHPGWVHHRYGSVRITILAHYLLLMQLCLPWIVDKLDRLIPDPIEIMRSWFLRQR